MQRSGFFKRIFLFTALMATAFLPGCTSSDDGRGQPVPNLTFAHIMKRPVEIGKIGIVNLYDGKDDSDDMAGLFPTPPDTALERYFENRFEASGTQGRLVFTIGNAAIRYSYIEADSIVLKWGRLGGLDRYDLELSLTIEIRDKKDGKARSLSTHNIDIERYIALPESLSVVQREHEQLLFVETLVNDLDAAITEILASEGILVTRLAPP